MNRVEFNPEMLKLARYARKLTQSALAKAMNVKSAFISQLEAGVVGMPEEFLQKLTEKLKFPKSFFAQQTTFLDGCSKMYRAKRSFKSVDRNYIDSYASIYNTHISKLLEADLFDIKEFKLPEERPNELNSPEDIAIAIREYWNIPRGPIKNLVKVIEDAGIFVIPIRINNPDFDGTFYLNEKNDFALIIINANVPNDRFRFNLAHELGHLIMHRLPSPNCEKEAHEFASAFLMPAKDIGEDLAGICFWDLLQLKEKWRVSMQAIAYRAKSLNKINEEQYESIWKLINYHGYRKNEPAANIPNEKPVMLKYLINYYLKDLNYSKEQLCHYLDIGAIDYNKMYGILLGDYIEDNKSKTTNLRLIK